MHLDPGGHHRVGRGELGQRVAADVAREQPGHERLPEGEVVVRCRRGLGGIGGIGGILGVGGAGRAGGRLPREVEVGQAR
ncbi:hypothetical protein GCM10025868_42230 [Angustibacter aerolatus]|uniref:Uncharacterized protein n=1 Tax=Angustibacter aerolatus TaxID=1162965 RepID=A0ABQ6JLU1_9ACTN|nr:hypothetical protein GCM10025868_42230 [Angustibacter aerolatus]